MVDTPDPSEKTTQAFRTARASFAPGGVLGNRYRIVSRLGRGGMGEVWLAFDLRLQVEVALKSLLTDRFTDEQALELLRSEVRSARAVVSPNVCRIFDLVVEDGQELVSMEYVDGQTLTALLKSRAPLDLSEARPMASQLLAGLEAIHQAGLVHRDIKPENIMITRSGRVVIMDFGVAKGVTEDRSGTVSGTPAYMAPEQMRGEALDARADLFSAGVVLAEMASPFGIGERSTRDDLWRGAREQPPRFPDGPWRAVLERAVANDRERRFASATALARALEEVTLRVEGAEDKRPYPGLASFMEADAQFFFGREAEVEAVWKKLQRAHLLAVIGPSGAGKSSFIHAGVVPSMPEDWHHVLFHPGAAPFVSLAHVLVPEFAGDTEATQKLLHLNQIDVGVALLSSWRQRHAQAILIIDQFEELFTLNPTEEQARFAELLGRVVTEADVHVLVSIRDDFFFRCHAQQSLEPLFNEITPLGAPTGASLRRALVQPALACGYRFEDEALVDEMLEHVGGSRGSLPLLAFAVASLWERRDREAGLLTRPAYESIGGVSGALAQHAEQTLNRIGIQRQPIVREIFRNMVTAEGTRAARDMEELLSVFDEPEIAREVLRELVNARLLTSFRLTAREGESTPPGHRVEIIHESLLTAWPRLVRWRTQDADSAQLRDQLRQAARLWEERGRSEDLLWTGAAFQEFQVWHERYPGGLTAMEESFAQAMVDKAERQRRRRRRIAVAAGVLTLAVLAVVTTLYRMSVVQAQRSDAKHLFALGQAVPETNTSVRLAYAIASLERADTPEVRRFVLGVLWRGPPALVMPYVKGGRWNVDFTPDDQHLLVDNVNYGNPVEVWPIHGGAPLLLQDSLLTDADGAAQFGPDSDVLITGWGQKDRKFRLWRYPQLVPIAELEFENRVHADVSVNREYMVTRTAGEEEKTLLQVWALAGGIPKLLGHRQIPHMPRTWDSADLTSVDASGTRVVYGEGPNLWIVPVRDFEAAQSVLVGRHDADVVQVGFHPDGARIISIDRSGEILVWSNTPNPSVPLRRIVGQRNIIGPIRFDTEGSRFGATSVYGSVQIWDLAGLPGQEPMHLGWSTTLMSGLVFHPDGTWIATSNFRGAALWPLARLYPRVLRVHQEGVLDAAFSPDGKLMVSAAPDGVWLWRLQPGASGPERIDERGAGDIRWDPRGRFLIAVYYGLAPRILPLEAGEVRELPVPKGNTTVVASGLSISPDGRFAAISWKEVDDLLDPVIYVYDLENGGFRTLKVAEARVVSGLEFTRDGNLLGRVRDELRLWDVGTGAHRVLTQGGRFVLDRDRRVLLTAARGRLLWHDIEKETTRELPAPDDRVEALALDVSRAIAVTGSASGLVRVHRATGEEPHLLVGHEGPVSAVAVDPQGRWIATAGADKTIRLWPIPEGRPLHTLPRNELLAKLRTLTNIRVVPDTESTTGHRIDFDPFPGWENAPTW